MANENNIQVSFFHLQLIFILDNRNFFMFHYKSKSWSEHKKMDVYNFTGNEMDVHIFIGNEQSNFKTAI